MVDIDDKIREVVHDLRSLLAGAKGLGSAIEATNEDALLMQSLLVKKAEEIIKKLEALQSNRSQA